MGCIQSKARISKSEDEFLTDASWREYPETDAVNNLTIDRKDREYWRDLLAWQPPVLKVVDDKVGNCLDMDGLQKCIINGQVDSSLPPEKNSIRIFLSSTFNDYGNERNLLLKDVLPYLKTIGSKFDIDVVISEMRWGISDQAVKENRTIDLCMKEIENCRHVSIGPFFCLMLGNRYGYCPPPPILSASKYEEAIQRAEKIDNINILKALKSCYRLDENLQPSSYVLFNSDEGKEDDCNSSINSSIIHDVSNFVKAAFHIDNLGTKDEENEVDETVLAKYFESPSVTELEVSDAFFNSTDEISKLAKRVAVFHRHIDDVGDPPSPIYYDEFVENLENLKSRSRSFASDNGATFRRYQVPSLEPSHMDPYLVEFANDFCSWVVESIHKIVKERTTAFRNVKKHTSTTALLREISSHHNHAQRAFVGREDIVQKLVRHCEQGTGAIVLRGSSGSGKTTLLGQVAQKVSNSSSHKSVILLRFLGTTPASSTSDVVAASMLQQLMLAFPDIARKATNKEDEATMRASDRFLQLLRAISSRGLRVVMIIDSLDQLDPNDPGRHSYESWLPTLFGAGVLKNVAILLSALPDHLENIEAMKFHRIEDINPFTTQEGEEMLNHLCHLHGRSLSKIQRGEILGKFQNEQSTLFLTIAFLQSLRWKSWDTGMEVPNTTKSQISLLLKELSEDFGKHLIRAIVSHMTLTHGGMSLDELRNVVSIDKDVLKEVFKWHRTPDGLVPPLLINEIFVRLDPYLVRRNIDGVETRFWYHRAFWESAEIEYLSSPKAINKVHQHAIEFYSVQPTYKVESKVNIRKMRQLPYRLCEAKEWTNLGKFLATHPEALVIELATEAGQVRYASYWRSLKEATNGDSIFNVETVLPHFVLNDNELITFEYEFLIGDFLKKYFNAYEASLKVFKKALEIDHSNPNIFENKFPITDTRQLDCMSRIGDVFTHLSKYDEAYKWLYKSYSELRRHVGEDGALTIRVLGWLSRLMKDWGKYKESLEYDTRLYDLSLKKFGDNDERVADAARQLARTHYLSGRYQVAIGYYSKNLNIRKLLYGDQHPQTAVALNCLGMANKVLGNYEEGLKYCNQAYQVKLELYGKNHSDTAVTIDNIGSLYHLDGQFDKAMECYEEAWGIKHETLGEDHADSIMMYGQIGRLYHDKGNVKDALPLLQKNLQLRNKILDSRHPQIAVAKSPLAAIMVDMGNYEEAFKLASESVALRSEVLGGYHPYTAFSYDTVALAELGRGNVDAAEDAANISLSIREDALGPLHPRCAVAHMTLAKVKSAQGRMEKAIGEAENAVRINDLKLRGGHPHRKRAEDLLLLLQSKSRKE